VNRTAAVGVLACCMPWLALADVPTTQTRENPGSVSRLIQLGTYKDLDWGGRLAACIKDLPPEGGICDDRVNGGPQVLNGQVTLAKNNVQILLNATTIRFKKNASIEITGLNVSIVGIGKQATTFALEAGATFRIGNANSVARKWVLQGLGIISAAGNKGGTGLSLENAREGRLQDVLVYGFGDGVGVLVGQNCWTIIFDDVNVSTNHIGLSFRGTQPNAWAIRSALFSQNAIGVLFDLGTGSGQGISFSDGTHFEGNTTSGILFQSGDLHEVSVTNAYVEIFAGQRFVELRGQGPAIRLRAFDYSGGHIYTKDQPPFHFEARQTDFVRAMIRGLSFTASSPGIPSAVFNGTGASGVVIGASTSDARGLSTDAHVLNENGGAGVSFNVAETGRHLSRTNSLAFSAWSGSDCQDQSMELLGAKTGDSVALGVPGGAARIPGVLFSAFVDSDGRVTVRGCKLTAGPAPRPPAGAFRVDVWGS
jgi:hypothetical protein